MEYRQDASDEARAIFQTSWRQNCFYRAVHPLVSARRGEPVGRYGENALANFSFLQSHGVGGLHCVVYPDRVFFWEEVETSRSLVGPNGALPDSRGDSPHCSRRDFQTFLIRVFDAPSFQKT